MDCVIPAHSIRTFCASLVCLSKIGNEIYFEFDALEGLSVRALNDAKSAYSLIRFEPAFFERCTAPPSLRRKRTAMTQDDLRFSCRVALKALTAIVRPRKDVVSLRICSETESSALYVTFEFQIQKNRDALLRVIHRIKAADANSVTAVVSKEDGSEIVASPKVFSQLLSPLKRTSEAAMIINKNSQVVSVTSFHHCDNVAEDAEQGANNNNAILQANSASLLKTETGMTCDNFNEFFFRDGRVIDDDDSLPPNVNEQVVLVFPIREFKAMLQFCSQAKLDEELPVTLYFHWGGKPMLIESESREQHHFTAELVLATLHHKLLSTNLTQPLA
ncbi:hypothetical protein MPSEU_000208100 [Mayamaea pseudoterrestris]|nr:hypothetical protein MPSEU_000208100 [Mayamaea pseudoterrestris]